jgi:hypothetical protein
MKITEHAYERAKERCGLNRAAFERMAGIALSDGLRHADARGRLKRWMDREFLTHRNGNNMRIYGEHLFVFAGTDLITVLHVPHDLRRAATKLQK